MLRGFVVASFLLQFVGGATADAADVKVLSAVGMREVMLDLAPKFERATGHTLAMSFDASGVIVRRIETGETVSRTVWSRDSKRPN